MSGKRKAHYFKRLLRTNINLKPELKDKIKLLQDYDQVTSFNCLFPCLILRRLLLSWVFSPRGLSMKLPPCMLLLLASASNMTIGLSHSRKNEQHIHNPSCHI